MTKEQKAVLETLNRLASAFERIADAHEKSASAAQAALIFTAKLAIGHGVKVPLNLSKAKRQGIIKKALELPEKTPVEKGGAD